MLDLTINGKQVAVPQGTTILQSAKSVGIKIPTFCYHAQMAPLGACRVCLVEVEKMPKLQIACATLVAEGMKVFTDSPAAVKAQKGVIEFLLLNHPLDCPVCDKGGKCELQDLTYRYGPTASRYIFPRYKHDRHNIGPMITRDQNRCIQCKRCVRICREYHGKSCLGTIERGFYSEIASFNFETTTCDFCGDCIEVCPVGALTSRPFRFKARVWNLNKVESTCPYCADGCRMSIESLETEIKRVRPRRLPGEYVSDTHLCVRGYFGYHFVNHPDRIKTPLLKKNEQFVPITWEEALTTIIKKLNKIKESSGADAIAGLGSPRCTNEENYLFQKFLRAVIGTNNIDHLMTDHGSEWNELWVNAIPQSIPFSEIRNAKVIFIVGADVSVQNPVLGLNIKQAVMQNNAILIELNSARTELRRFITHQLRCRYGTELAGLNAMIKILVDQNLIDSSQLNQVADGVNEYKNWITRLSLEQLIHQTGLDSSILADAVERLIKLKNDGKVIILFGRGVIEHPHREHILIALSNLVVFLGDNAKLMPLFEYNNSRGAIELGITPYLYPGYAKVEVHSARNCIEKLWNTALPQTSGMNFTKMIDSATVGNLKAMYIIGENPVMRFPDRIAVSSALENLDFLVVQDLFLTETAQYADIVLPAASFAEKDGTFTNTEGRIQPVTPAFEPLYDAKPDWWILTELANRMGANWQYRSPSDILNEIITTVPLYKSVRPTDFGRDGIILPAVEPFPYTSSTTDLFGKKKK
ncbi:MAG: NADH-quinone oxidoreductase subunit NuoG, partial [bacterium]|nr:NADH-quinone oxidoreductase subunit NuoG [bacterium]